MARLRFGRSKISVFQLVEPVAEAIDFGTVVVHHRVDDAVQQRRRALAERAVIARADAANLGERARDAGVNGHQELFAEKEVDVLGLEAMLRFAEVDAVQDQVEIVAVGFDLGMVNLAQRILDRQFVEVEHAGEDPTSPQRSGSLRSTHTQTPLPAPASPDSLRRRTRSRRPGSDRW